MILRFLFISSICLHFVISNGQKYFKCPDLYFDNYTYKFFISSTPNEKILDKDDSKNENHDLILDLTIANDMTYFTDHYFSSGISFKVFAPFMTKSPLNKLLLSFNKEDQNYYALTFSHNLYTPIYIDTLSTRTIDHPFAAYILFGSRKESFNIIRNYKLTSELQLGLIGPIAGGQVFQNTLHDHIPIAGPVEGWEHQVQNDFCVQYLAQIEKEIIDFERLELNGFGGGCVGVPHTEAQMGLYVRSGYFDDYFQHIGFSEEKTLQFWFFCAGDFNYVVYNATLQGGISNPDNSNILNRINRFMWHTRFGGTLTYKSIKLELAQEVTSPSFPTALWHRWAYFSMMLKL